MSNALLLTLLTTIIGAIFIIIQFHELLAAQSAFTSPVDGQRSPDPDYQGDLDPWSSTALEDYQNTTFLEQGLVERGFKDVRGILPCFLLLCTWILTAFLSSTFTGINKSQHPKSKISTQIEKSQHPKSKISISIGRSARHQVLQSL